MAVSTLVPLLVLLAAVLALLLAVGPKQLTILVRIAMANLLASKVNLIIGLLIAGGTFVFLTIGALVDSLNASMARSVTGSVAGHVQIYSSKSRDELALYGGQGGTDPDLKAMESFPRIKELVEKLPGVKTVVPMGSSGALITPGNVVDVALERLRALYRAKSGSSTDATLTALAATELEQRIEGQKGYVRQIIKVLNADAQQAMTMLDAKSVEPEVVAALKKVSSDDFWRDFDIDAFGSLEFLENRVAPQVSDAQLLFLRYLGTDLDRFQGSFDRMQIIDGQPVPPGHRGFLIAKFFYEEGMKLKNARRLDKIKEAKDVNQRTIAGDEELQRFVKENRSQTRDLVLQLDAEKTKVAVARLQKHLGSDVKELSSLLSSFFDTTDYNFDARYDFFYAELAPLVQLYRVRVGDTLTIKAFSKGGAVQSVNVKVYGTFAFKGLEKSPLAGVTNLMDLMSFRDLYGYLTSDKLEELKALKAATAAKEVSRENAEADLFGAEGTTVVAEATPGLIDADKELGGGARRLRQEDLFKRVYSQNEIDDGVVLNAAVVLDDPSRTPATIAAINELSQREGLGLKAVSWQQASGLLGQIITGFQLILIVAVVVIFLIAMFVINNAMMMATLQRTQTIGTMRAIGAQRGFVLVMVLVEALALGVVFGAIGIVAGGGTVLVLNRVGIPATNDYAYFFFSGSKLLPTLEPRNIVLALVIIFAVTFLSTLIPALVATRISPLRAMQADAS
jgi:ABC-type lipoprotein release transport system permease subunit